MFSPLEQFEITPLIFLFNVFDFFGLTLTNFSLFALLFCSILFILSVFTIFNPKLLPSLRLYIFESFYLFVLEMIMANLGQKGAKYFPLVFFLFFFILAFNLFGLFPYSYTLTSQIVVAATLSFSLFIGLIVIAIVRFKLNFFALFFPSGAPTFLAFLLVPIEIVSFFSRPFSLAIRLFANMTAGHVLLKILAGFTLTFFSSLIGASVFINPFAVFAVDFERLVYTLAIFSHDFVTYLATYWFFDKPLFNQNDLTLLSYADFFSKNFMDLNEFNSLNAVKFGFKIFPTLNVVAPGTLSLFPITSPSLPTIDSPDPAIDVLITLARESTPGPIKLPRLDEIPYTVLLLRPIINFDNFFKTETKPYINFEEAYDEALYDVLSFDSLGLMAGLTYNAFTLDLTFISSIFSSFISFGCCAVAALIPVIVLSLFIILELFVAVLQAYVFSILAVIYLRDSLELH